MAEAWAHVTLISAALSHQKHINYFRACFFWMNGELVRESRSLPLSPCIDPLPRLAARGGLRSAAGFGTRRGLSVKFRTVSQHGKDTTQLCFPTAPGRESWFPPPSSQQITGNLQVLSTPSPLKIKHFFLLHTNSTLIPSAISRTEL